MLTMIERSRYMFPQLSENETTEIVKNEFHSDFVRNLKNEKFREEHYIKIIEQIGSFCPQPGRKEWYIRNVVCPKNPSTTLNQIL